MLKIDALSANEYLNKIMTTIMVSNIWILQLMIHNMENYIKQRIYLFMALFYVKQKTSNAQRIYYSHEMDPLHFFRFERYMTIMYSYFLMPISSPPPLTISSYWNTEFFCELAKCASWLYIILLEEHSKFICVCIQ